MAASTTARASGMSLLFPASGRFSVRPATPFSRWNKTGASPLIAWPLSITALPIQISDQFESDSRSLAAANAQGSHPALQPSPFQRGDQRRHDTRSRRADRVPKRRRTAVHVAFFIRDAEFLRRDPLNLGQAFVHFAHDRQSAVWAKRWSVRFNTGGPRS